jgi:hypothetical protein
MPIPIPPFRQQHVFFLDLPVFRRSSLLRGEGGGGGRGAESYDRKKACPFINHSILSGNQTRNRFLQVTIPLSSPPPPTPQTTPLCVSLHAVLQMVPTFL